MSWTVRDEREHIGMLIRDRKWRVVLGGYQAVHQTRFPIKWREKAAAAHDDAGRYEGQVKAAWLAAALGALAEMPEQELLSIPRDWAEAWHLIREHCQVR